MRPGVSGRPKPSREAEQQYEAALAIGLNPALLHQEFRQVRQLATFRNGLGVDDDEQGTPVYLVSGLRKPWPQTWPAFRDYS